MARKTFPTLVIYKLGKTLDEPPERVTTITLYSDDFMIGPLPTDGVYLMHYSRNRKKKDG
jgi:hypothetical protein